MAKHMGSVADFNLVVKEEPVGAKCTVINGTGKLPSANIHNVFVSCVSAAAGKHGIGGTLNVAAPEGLKLKLNDGANDHILALMPGDTRFTFPQTVTAGDTYTVTAEEAPAGYGCSVANGTGPANGAIDDVAVSCSKLTGHKVDLKLEFDPNRFHEANSSNFTGMYVAVGEQSTTEHPSSTDPVTNDQGRLIALPAEADSTIRLADTVESGKFLTLNITDDKGISLNGKPVGGNDWTCSFDPSMPNNDYHITNNGSTLTSSTAIIGNVTDVTIICN
jgi:hypothetical protein